MYVYVILGISSLKSNLVSLSLFDIDGIKATSDVGHRLINLIRPLLTCRVVIECYAILYNILQTFCFFMFVMFYFVGTMYIFLQVVQQTLSCFLIASNSPLNMHIAIFFKPPGIPAG